MSSQSNQQKVTFNLSYIDIVNRKYGTSFKTREEYIKSIKVRKSLIKNDFYKKVNIVPNLKSFFSDDSIDYLVNNQH